jgi:hypothetical protein
MPARSDDRGRIRDELLAEIVPRQLFLAIIHAITAVLFASGIWGAASPSVLAAWLAYTSPQDR